MIVLVTGPESSGTKMVAALLERAGARVEHRTPRPRIGKVACTGVGYDAIVVVVRSSYTCARSMVENHHTDDLPEESRLDQAYRMVPAALHAILGSLHAPDNIHLISYESVIHEPEALRALCRDLGLPEHFDHDPIKDANAKFFGGAYFRDPRSIEDRRSA